MLDLFARSGGMIQARFVFDSMESHDTVSWNTLLRGYGGNGENELVLELFDGMNQEQVSPDARSFVAALTACASLAERKPVGKKIQWILKKGRDLHSRALEGFCCDMFVECTLIDMYAKFGRMAEARAVFDGMISRNSVAWNVLLRGYVDNGECDSALEVFDGMKAREADARTYVHALEACVELAGRDREELDERISSNISSSRKWLEKGMDVYSRAVEGRCCDLYVKNTAIKFFGRCGRMLDAQAVFDSIDRKNVISWNCLIQGYVENGENELGLELIAHMNADGVAKNSQTFAAAITACGNLSAAETGKSFHADALDCGLERDSVVANCLVDFYGKCGAMDAAEAVFDSIIAAEKDVVAWNCLMCGYSLQGDAARVFDVFERMREGDISPDSVTFLCMLTTCSHAGLTSKGREVFGEMRSEFGLRPDLKHYACMVDLLGRGNCLEEALRMVKGLPLEANAVIWRGLLSASLKWKNVAVGKVAYEALMSLDERDGSACVLMAGVYESESSKASLHQPSVKAGLP